MTNDEIKAQAIADVARETIPYNRSIEWMVEQVKRGIESPSSGYDTLLAYAVAQREQNIRIVVMLTKLRDGLLEDGYYSGNYLLQLCEDIIDNQVLSGNN